MKFLDDSAWLCMEKLKKHSFETKNPTIDQNTSTIQKIKQILSYQSDCYLRQGDGGTKTARFGSRTCFLR